MINIKTDYIFFDIEASSLWENSYPIELGWTALDLDVKSSLIKPLETWGLETWSDESEQIHGITRDELASKGENASCVAEHFLKDVEGKTLVSDAPTYDLYWLKRLMNDTGYGNHRFKIVTLTEAYANFAELVDPPLKNIGDLLSRVEVARKFYQHTHRAGEDALSMAAACRVIFDDEFRSNIEIQNKSMR